MGNYILILIRMFMLPGLENHKLQEHDFPRCIRGFPLKLWPVLSQTVFFPNRRRCSAYNRYYRNQKTRAIAVFTTVGVAVRRRIYTITYRMLHVHRMVIAKFKLRFRFPYNQVCMISNCNGTLQKVFQINVGVKNMVSSNTHPGCYFSGIIDLIH